MYDNTLHPFSIDSFDSSDSRTLLFALIIQYALSTQGHGHVNPVHAREALRHANADESRATIANHNKMAADVITVISARSYGI
jgi:hypothetical protein